MGRKFNIGFDNGNYFQRVDILIFIVEVEVQEELFIFEDSCSSESIEKMFSNGFLFSGSIVDDIFNG